VGAEVFGGGGLGLLVVPAAIVVGLVYLFVRGFKKRDNMP
jgi:hypothetical protein